MRKEVKLGMAIGGILLAVVVGYLMIIPSGKPKNSPVLMAAGDRVTNVVAAPSGGRTEAAPAASAGNNTQTPAAPAADDRHGAAAAGTHAGQNNWIMALNGQESASVVDPVEAPGGASIAPAADVTPRRAAAAAPAARGASLFSGHGMGDVTVTATPGARTVGAAAPAVTPAAATPGAVAAAAGKPRTHIVQAGENYSRISMAAYGSPKYYNLILKANPKVDPTRLKPGMTIVLPELPAESAAPATPAAAVAAAPGAAAHPAAVAHAQPAIDPAKEYRVVSGDSLHRIAVKLYGKISMVDKIYDLNKQVIGPDRTKLKLNMVLKLPAPPVAGGSPSADASH